MKYRQVESTYYVGPTVSNMNRNTMDLYLYLFINDHINLSGVLSIGIPIISAEIKIEIEETKKSLNKLIELDRVVIVKHDIWVVKFISRQKLTNSKIVTGVIRCFNEINNKELKEVIKTYYDIGDNYIKYRFTEDGEEIPKEVINKEKPYHKKREYLLNIPEEDINEFKNKFNISRQAVISKGEDLDDWVENNKPKKNYKSFLRVCLKKDYDKGKKKGQRF